MVKTQRTKVLENSGQQRGMEEMEFGKMYMALWTGRLGLMGYCVLCEEFKGGRSERELSNWM